MRPIALFRLPSPSATSLKGEKKEKQPRQYKHKVNWFMKCRFLIQSSEQIHSALFPVPSKEVVSLYQSPGQALYSALLPPFPQDSTFHLASISHLLLLPWYLKPCTQGPRLWDGSFFCGNTSFSLEVWTEEWGWWAWKHSGVAQSSDKWKAVQLGDLSRASITKGQLTEPVSAKLTFLELGHFC